jgi:hypothetical protein
MEPFRNGTFMERNAWIILLVLSALILILGAGEIISGQSGDPAMVETTTGMHFEDLQAQNPPIAHLLDLTAKIIGALWIGLGLFGIFTAANAFKAGRKWSWYAFWTIAVVNALVLTAFLTTERVPGGPSPPAFYSAPAMILIIIVVLWASRRAFFDRPASDSSD